MAQAEGLWWSGGNPYPGMSSVSSTSQNHFKSECQHGSGSITSHALLKEILCQPMGVIGLPDSPSGSGCGHQVWDNSISKSPTNPPGHLVDLMCGAGVGEVG